MPNMSFETLLKSSGTKAARLKATGSSSALPGTYTYTTTVDCDGSTTSSVYSLAEASGTYNEDLCGGTYIGTLEFIGEITVQGDAAITGWAYNGTDQTGVYGYFFSDTELPSIGSYVVLLGDPHVAGQSFEPALGWPATRA